LKKLKTFEETKWLHIYRENFSKAEKLKNYFLPIFFWDNLKMAKKNSTRKSEGPLISTSGEVTLKLLLPYPCLVPINTYTLVIYVLPA